MKLPKTLNNWISITGFLMAVNSLIIIAILFVHSMMVEHTNPYNGIFTYIVFPLFLILGMIMIPIGMLIARKRLKRGDKPWPVLDLNLPKQRRGLIFVSIVTILFLGISAVGSYEAFSYTESVVFCGKLCHQVMEPEYVTYQHSPHARVACVECHVGEGADWYVKSKMSGLYQVYSVLFHKYSRPIETPLKNLRPARETCERCHWPEKFYARKLRSQRSYLTDSLNTEWNIDLLMKIGPKFSSLGLIEGIHWHINKDVQIEYVASAADRESIPWVKYTNLKTGEVTIFQDPENPIDQKALDTLEHRTMDCMDCHNRPSHGYKSAPAFMNYAMTSGEVPRELPWIKKVSMNVLKGPFTDKDSSLTYIRDSITNFYKTGFPTLYAAYQAQIGQALKGIEKEFSENVFPYMRVTAGKYLNHIGHLESDGCFRCHSDRHTSDKGKVISKDCNLCHTIIAQGPTGNMMFANADSTLEFRHPIDVKDNWKTYFCTECHKELYP